MRTLITILLLGVMIASQSQTPNAPYQNETKEQKDERMAWWREARFGMFIHWGVYAVPAGTYNGEQINGIGEWIMLKGQIPVTEYKAYAKEFNPVKYDPEQWAELAKKAGMRYIIITSKHHDGFALFPSAVTDWDVVDATPYGKDLIGPLAEAAKNEGLKFGLYYSQAQDWIHPGGAKWRDYEEGEGWDELHYGDFDTYLAQIAAPQVGEILSRYRPDVLCIATNLQLEQKKGKTNIGSWTDARTWISYTFEIEQPGTFNLQADIAGEEETEITYKLGDQPKTNVKLKPSGNYSDFEVMDLGTLTIEEVGTYTLEIRAVSEDWAPVNLRNISFKPTE